MKNISVENIIALMADVVEEKNNPNRKRNPVSDSGVWYIPKTDTVWVTFSEWKNLVAYTQMCGYEVPFVIDEDFVKDCVFIGEYL